MDLQVDTIDAFTAAGVKLDFAAVKISFVWKEC